MIKRLNISRPQKPLYALIKPLYALILLAGINEAYRRDSYYTLLWDGSIIR